jgi:hypothetical protein
MVVRDLSPRNKYQLLATHLARRYWPSEESWKLSSEKTRLCVVAYGTSSLLLRNIENAR